MFIIPNKSTDTYSLINLTREEYWAILLAVINPAHHYSPYGEVITEASRRIMHVMGDPDTVPQRPI